MKPEDKVIEILKEIQSDIPGFIAASVVDLDSGMTLAVLSSRTDFDLSAASAFNCEIVKQKLKTISALGLNSSLEDILLTLSDQLHLIKIVDETCFIYLAAERAATNLAIIRSSVAKRVPSIL